jgi:SAM-dependent methyltransferase
MDECLLYNEPELYDLLFPNAEGSARVQDTERRERIIASEKFYLEEAKAAKGGPVLELACGSGRLTIPIAQSGVEIVGADSSLSMLEAARAKAAAAGVTVKFFAADMRDFSLPTRYSLIILAGNSLQHLLTAEDLKQCLASSRRHLAPGGRLVFDVSNPDRAQLMSDSGERKPVMRVIDSRRGEIVLEERATYDAASGIRSVVWYLSVSGQPDFRVIDYRLRMIFPDEIEHALATIGFRVETRYGEYTRIPFEPSSPRQVNVCLAL